jgi:hypothetical protein
MSIIKNIESFTQLTKDNCPAAGGTWGIIPGNDKDKHKSSQSTCYFTSGINAPTCPTGSILQSSQCKAPITCPPGFTKSANNDCVKQPTCSNGLFFNNGACASSK